MHRGIHFILEAGKPLRKRDRLLPETEKEHSLKPHLPLHEPGPWAGGHCGWRPGGRSPGRPAPFAERSARRPARCIEPRSAGSARLPPPDTGGPAAEIYHGAGRRLPGPPGAQAPITGSHGGPGPRLPSPRWRALAPPPAHSSPFMRTPSAAAAAAASAAAVAAAGRPDWLVAAAPAVSHGPRRVRLTGGAAGAALAGGQTNPGARGGEVPQPPAGLCPGPASPACPPRAHSRPRLLFPPQLRPGGAPAEPTHRRRPGAGAEGGGGVRPSPRPRPCPLP